MPITTIKPPADRSYCSTETIDLLATTPSVIPFSERVRLLELTPALEAKVFRAEYQLASNRTPPRKPESLTSDEEKELATEVLLLRHRFTELLFSNQIFRQATLTVLQNIYLFNNRKIYFGNSFASAENERQDALLLFSDPEKHSNLPLEKAFQHLIVSRIWNRILSRSSQADQQDSSFISLHMVVEKLNTLRNIYMLLTTGLVRMLATKTNALYRESVTYEDAVQIGGMGVARASYRYHPSSGIRFSTFAANWIFREIQRQSLDARLVRISTHTVEKFTKAAKLNDAVKLNKYSAIIESATAIPEQLAGEYTCLSRTEFSAIGPSPVSAFETIQLRSLLVNTIDQKLSPKSGDIIKRRYGLPPYQGAEQSILAISKHFGVTRSSIYQLEQAALKKLQKSLRSELL